MLPVDVCNNIAYNQFVRIILLRSTVEDTMMKQKLSFCDFIKENFENDIADAVGSFISDNPDELECSTNFVDTPEEAELLDFDIKWINVSDAPGMGILFDVIIEAEIAISETVRRNQESDSDSQWFRVSCSGDLNSGLKNFEICYCKRPLWSIRLQSVN